MQAVQRPLKGIGLTVMVIVGLLVAVIVIMQYLLWLRSAGQIHANLVQHHETRKIIVLYRDWFPMNQVCLLYAVKKRGASPVVHVSMVQGDLDGGTWGDAREYETLAECRSHFNRG